MRKNLMSVKTVGDLKAILARRGNDVPVLVYSSYNMFRIKNIIETNEVVIINLGDVDNKFNDDDYE
jgi:hypothetical protein